MEIHRLLVFGVVREIFGTIAIEIALKPNTTVGELKEILEREYPKLKQLSSYVVAVSEKYSKDDRIIKPHEDLAIIPPVSGG